MAQKRRTHTGGRQKTVGVHDRLLRPLRVPLVFCVPPICCHRIIYNLPCYTRATVVLCARFRQRMADHERILFHLKRNLLLFPHAMGSSSFLDKPLVVGATKSPESHVSIKGHDMRLFISLGFAIFLVTTTLEHQNFPTSWNPSRLLNVIQTFLAFLNVQWYFKVYFTVVLYGCLLLSVYDFSKFRTIDF